MHRRAVLRVALVLVVLAVGAAVVAAPAAADSMDVDHTVGMTDEPGTVDVTTRVHVPAGTTGLRVRIPEGTDVYETRGFTRVDDRTYEWTRSTDEPSLSYTMEGNVTVDRGAGERHLFAVTDEWAIVRSPRVTLREPGSAVDENERYTVDGEGVAGPHITYLGPGTTRTRDANGQRFRLVVPAAADMVDTPAAALDSLAHASRRIGFGERDDEVFVVVAPTTVEWAAVGLQRGDADMWVRDVESVDSPRNAWVHEYVHTRQDFTATSETQWTVEAMAEYYAAMLPYEAGRIDYDAFRSKMERGTREEYDDVRLADTGTWTDGEGNYEKGGLVWGALDRRLHADSATSMDAVVASFGDDEVSQSEFLDAVEAAGGAGARSDAREYTETTATPPVWDQAAHVEAYGGPLISQEFDAFAVSGPYRETGVAGPELVTGETLEATVVVRNEGTDSGDYDVPFRVDGRTVDTRSGSLEAGETATLTFTRAFDAPGEYDLRAGTATGTAVVAEPADPTVTGLTVDPERAARGERVEIRATVESTADRPANGTVAIAVDGETVERQRVAFLGQTTVVATTTFDRAGEHGVRADGRTATITVREATVTPGAGSAGGDEASDGGETPGSGTATSGDGAGFGVAVAVAALAGAMLLLGWRYP